MLTRPQPLPAGRHGLPREVVEASQRTRLIDAMVKLVDEEGYANVTVVKLSCEARTAKRTFSVYFEDREDCFIAAYDRCSAEVFAALTDAVGGYVEPIDRIRSGMSGLLEFLAEHPATAKVWTEAVAAGPRAAERRAQTSQALADLYLALHRTVPSDEPPPAVPLTRERALAVVGAVEVPLLVALREHGPEALPGLAASLTESVYTLVYGRRPPVSDAA